MLSLCWNLIAISLFSLLPIALFSLYNFKSISIVETVGWVSVCFIMVIVNILDILFAWKYKRRKRLES